jgi:hypothetical protein
VPAPLGFLPQPADPGAQPAFVVIFPIEVLPHAEQPGQQKRRLDDVAAVVFPGEPHCLAGVAIQEMRQDAVIAVGLQQKTHHGQEPLDRLGTADPAARDADDDGHDAEAAATRGDNLRAVLRPDVAALARQAAHGMGKVPEVAEGLLLHDVKQRVVVEIDWARGTRPTFPG